MLISLLSAPPLRTAGRWLRPLTLLIGRGCGAEAIWVAAGQVLVALGIFANLFVLGHWLPPTEFGVVALGLALSGILQQSLWAPVSNAMSRFYSASTETGSTDSLLREGFNLAKIAAVVSVALVAFSFSVSNALNASWAKIIPIAVAVSMGYGYTTTLDGLQNAARRRIIYAAHQTLGQVLRLTFAGILIMSFAREGILALAGYALASLTTSITGTFLLRRIKPPKPADYGTSTVCWRSTLRKYAFPFATWGLLSGFQAASDRWSIRAFCAGEDVGLYSAAYQLGYYPVVLIGMAISQFVMPIIFQEAGNGASPIRMQACFRAVTSLTRAALYLALIAVLASVLMHKVFFALFFGRGYAAAAPLWPISLASGALFVAGQLAAAVSYSFGKSHLLIVPFAGTAVLGVCLNILGAAFAGIQGVACAVLFTSLLYFAGPAVVAQRIISALNRDVSSIPVLSVPGTVGAQSFVVAEERS